MSKYTFRSSRADSWAEPRPYRDPSTRLARFGPIQPMEQKGFFSRLFNR
ncbi:hypothetical protein [Aurantiacibacter rhizosphaerae]|nr:hypothetical protein [Aurantiacibacter rhizosphaerae]